MGACAPCAVCRETLARRCKLAGCTPACSIAGLHFTCPLCAASHPSHLPSLPALRSLRVHGLIVGSPEKRRADPAVLRGLCSHTLPSGKNEVRFVVCFCNG